MKLIRHALFVSFVLAAYATTTIESTSLRRVDERVDDAEMDNYGTHLRQLDEDGSYFSDDLDSDVENENLTSDDDYESYDSDDSSFTEIGSSVVGDDVEIEVDSKDDEDVEIEYEESDIEEEEPLRMLHTAKEELGSPTMRKAAAKNVPIYLNYYV